MRLVAALPVQLPLNILVCVYPNVAVPFVRYTFAFVLLRLVVCRLGFAAVFWFLPAFTWIALLLPFCAGFVPAPCSDSFCWITAIAFSLLDSTFRFYSALDALIRLLAFRV